VNHWPILVGVLVVVALVAPLIFRMSRRDDGSKAEKRRVRQTAVLEELDRVLAPLVSGARDGRPLRVGPGADFFDGYMGVRQKIRYEFRSSTAMQFDRELGYLLTRPGPLEIPVGKFPERVERGLKALREEMTS
jgi:hypothetical protein